MVKYELPVKRCSCCRGFDSHPWRGIFHFVNLSRWLVLCDLEWMVCVIGSCAAGTMIRLCSTITSCATHCHHSSTSTVRETPGNYKPWWFGLHRRGYRGYQQQESLHYEKQHFICFLIYLMNLTKWIGHTERTDWRNRGNELWGQRMNKSGFILRRQLRRRLGRDVKDSRLSGRNSKSYPAQYTAEMLSTNLLQLCVPVHKYTVVDGADTRIYRMAQSRLTHFRTHFCLWGGGGGGGEGGTKSTHRERHMSCRFKTCSATMDRWIM